MGAGAGRVDTQGPISSRALPQSNGAPAPAALPLGQPTEGAHKTGALLRVGQHLGARIGDIRGDSLIRNSFFIMMTTIVNSVFGFAFWLVAARTFPAHVVGLTAALISASTIVILLASLGVGGTLIQSLPTQREPTGWSRMFWAGLATALVVSTLIGCAALVLLPLFAQEIRTLHNLIYATLFLIGTLALTVGTIFDYAFIAERSAGNMLARNTIISAGKVLLVVGFTLMASSNAQDLLGAWAASSVIGLCLGIALLIRRKSIERPPRVSAVARTAFGLRSATRRQ